MGRVIEENELRQVVNPLPSHPPPGFPALVNRCEFLTFGMGLPTLASRHHCSLGYDN